MPHFDTNNLPWIDSPDANVQGYIRDNVDPTDAENVRTALEFWQKQGFLIIKGGADLDLIDAYLEDMEQLMTKHKHYDVLVNCASQGIVPISRLSKEKIHHRCSPKLQCLSGCCRWRG